MGEKTNEGINRMIDVEEKFQKYGYERSEGEYAISEERKNKLITFYKKRQLVGICIDRKHEYLFDMGLLKTIYQQCEELGWIGETE